MYGADSAGVGFGISFTAMFPLVAASGNVVSGEDHFTKNKCGFAL